MREPGDHGMRVCTSRSSRVTWPPVTVQPGQRTGEVRVARQRGAAVARQLYLRHYRNKALRGVLHDLPYLARKPHAASGRFCAMGVLANSTISGSIRGTSHACQHHGHPDWVADYHHEYIQKNTVTWRPAHRKRARVRGRACTCPRALHLLLGVEPAVLPAAVRVAAPPGALLCELRVRLDLQPPALRAFWHTSAPAQDADGQTSAFLLVRDAMSLFYWMT